MHRRRIWFGLGLGIPLALTAALVLWGSTPLGPDPTAVAALASDAVVSVEIGRVAALQPVGQEPKTGLVLYPGGRVDFRSYAPLARAIAAQGYLVVIPRMPLNLAVLAPERATEIIEGYPEIEAWAVGGHSLGGAMAARYASVHLDRVEGLVLWASYPADANSLAGRSDLAVVSVYGTLDGLTEGDEIAASRALLPASTRWVEIEGGNHAQFGWYGAQKGDLLASISHEEQQRIAVEAAVALLEELSQ